MSILILALVVIFLVTAGCAAEQPGTAEHPAVAEAENEDPVSRGFVGGDVAHPVAELRIRPANVPVVSVTKEDAPRSRDGARLLQDLHGLVAVTEFGQESAPPEQVFGRVEVALFDEDNRIYVLDEAFSEVRVFDPDGSVVGSVGGTGQGPGEFNRPRSMVWHPDERTLYVGDLSRRMQAFAWESDEIAPSQLTFTHQLRPEIALFSLCLVGRGDTFLGHTLHFATRDAIFSDNPPPPESLRLVDREGVVRYAFGETYSSQNASISVQHSRGKLACDDSTGLVALTVESSLGETHVFDHEGARQAIFHYADFRPIDLWEDLDGGRTVSSSPAGGHHFLASSVPLGSGWVLNQFALRRRAELGSETVEIDSYLLNLGTTEAFYAGKDLPRIVAASPSVALAMIDDPFPVFTIMRYGE